MIIEITIPDDKVALVEQHFVSRYGKETIKETCEHIIDEAVNVGETRRINAESEAALENSSIFS